jgi:hypothetical protein
LYTITATRGWLVANGMGSSYTLTNPDLPGFLPAWAPSAPSLLRAAPAIGAVAIEFAEAPTRVRAPWDAEESGGGATS